MRKLKLLLLAACALIGGAGAVSADELDITSLYITNPGFELGNTSGWTVGASSDTGARSTSNGTYAMSNSEGSYLFNTWWQGIPITQTIASLPAGSYTLSAVLASDGATVYLIAGDDTDSYAYTETTDSKVGIVVSKDFTLTEASDFKVGAVGGENGTAGEHKAYTADGYWWYKADNFKLVLNLEEGATIPNAIVTKLLASVPTGTMSTSVQTALNSAVSTFESNATLDNYNALLTAISAANTSIASYAAISAGTISTGELGNWAISTTNGALACNTWSNEGDSDGSSMTTPFIQDWVASGTALTGGSAAGKLYYTLEGLNPGEQYNVSALVRVFNESEGDLGGASFYANSVSIDIDENGTACSGNFSTKGIYGTFNAKAVEVDENGKLEFGIALESTSALNWIAIKNVTISAYAGQAVESITLSKSSATLTTGDAFTLAATVSPDDADDQTVTWTSSNEAVATVSGTGIVTAVAAGTATITCTANDGSGVTGTCNVTVANATAPVNSSSIAEGTFYIRNVATGKFLGQGNGWDTQASLIKHGKPITVTLSNGKYKLTNIVKSGAGLGSDCYTDNGTAVELTVTETSEGSGIYTIAYGENLTAANAGSTLVSYQSIDASNALAQWQFLSYDDMQKNLSSTLDATFYVTGALAQRTASSNSAWTSSNVTTDFSGSLAWGNAYVCSESYHKDNFSYTQTVTVPNGTYNVSVQGFNSGSSEAYLVANDEKVLLRAQSSESHGMTCNSRTTAAKVFEAGYYPNTVEVTVTDHTLTLGVSGSSANCWVAWNNFELKLQEYLPVTALAATFDVDDDEDTEGIQIEEGNTGNISVTITPTSASFDALTYTSSDEAVATVSDAGVVTAVAEGTATITIAAEMEAVTTTLAINVVKPAVIPSTVTLNETEVALNATSNSATLTATVGAEGAPQTVVWTSSDETIATVADGVVTGVLPGTATIRATAYGYDEVYATATVTVTYPETEVAASTYTNEGATRTVSTLGANLIKNGAFEYPNNFYGWTTGSGAAMSADNFTLVTEEDNHYIKAKGHTGAGGVNSVGTGWAIEAGKTYVFGYKVKSTSAGNSEYHVVSLTNTLGTETTKVSKTETAVGTDWTNVAYTFTNTDFAYIQFRARWLNSAVSFDDFYLCEATTTTEGNVDYATAAIPTANIGTGAFQYSQAAIDDANALVQGTATVEDVQNAYDALTTINEPSNGQLFNVILTYGGWTYDQKAMTYLANGRNDAGLYNIQYKEAANTNLAQAFTFTKVSGNNYKMSQIDADGNVRYISTGVPYSGNTSQIRTTTDASKALVVTVIPTTTEGKWNLRNTEANQFIGSQDAGVYTVNSHIDFNIVETTKPSITINTTAAGYGTTMLPFAVASLPQDVKAYTCAAVDGEILTLKEVNALEANKPYIIEGAWDEIVTGDAQGTALTYTQGLLTGVYAATAAPVGSYVMQKNNDKVGFYKVAEGKQPTVGANRCYLTVSAASAREAFFFGNETDGISAVEALTSGNAEIYNAAGARIPTLQKGMNIVKSNGKSYKVIVK